MFVYYFGVGPGTGSISNAVKRLTVTDFNGFTTDVDAYVSGSNPTGILPNGLDREYANVVGFSFKDAGKVPTGGSSAVLWIETNAESYGTGKANIIDGAIAEVDLFAPIVPEPATLSLLGLGVLGLLGFRKRA